MDGIENENEWPERFTLGVARQIKHYREAKDWSFQKLADACTELGYRTIRTTLANLENGRRKSITVHEVIVIAEALDVSPVDLLFPGLPDGEVEYLPGKTARAWNALEHFTGETWPIGNLFAFGLRSRGLALMRLQATLDADPRIEESERARAANTTRSMLKEMGYTVEGPVSRPEVAPLPDLADIWGETDGTAT